MSVLADVLPADWQILWITQHGRQAAELWCREQQHLQQSANVTRTDRIEVAGEVSDDQLLSMQAAIVATSPHTHGAWLQRLLCAQVPTLCEKPLVLDPQQADELERQAVAANCPLGVNLELHYATYVERFARLVSGWDTPLATTALPAATSYGRSAAAQRPQLANSRTPDMLDDAERKAKFVRQTQLDHSQARHVELQWLDPWSEMRYGETKYSDVYTNIVDDMFPHCWSLLRHVTGLDDWQIKQVEYLPDSDVQLSLFHGNPVGGDTSANIRLSRRARQRTRLMSVRLAGRGDKLQTDAELDFSSEPGFIEQAGERHELQWDGERPLTRSLKSFLSVINAHRSGDARAWQSWPLSIVACRHSTQLSTAIAAQLLRAQQQWFQRCLAGDEFFADAHGEAFRQRLWVDMFVPIAAAAGQRVEFTDPQQLQNFFDSIAQSSRRTL